MEVKVLGTATPAPTVRSRSLELGCWDLHLDWEGYLEEEHFSRSWRIHRTKIREKDSSPLSQLAPKGANFPLGGQPCSQRHLP